MLWATTPAPDSYGGWHHPILALLFPLQVPGCPKGLFRWTGISEARVSVHPLLTPAQVWRTWRHFAIAGLDTDKATSCSHTLCRANSSPTPGREHPERKPGSKHCKEQKKKNHHKTNYQINQTKGETSENLNKQKSRAPFDFFAPGSPHWWQSHLLFMVLPNQITRYVAL